MMQLRDRLTYANLMATVAVFIALGGSAYAAAHLKRNSVGTSALRKNAVTSAKVKDGSLLAGDFMAGQLPVGERGPQGAPGATNVVVRYGQEAKPKQAEEGESNARCLSGEAVTGGGFDFSNVEPESFEFFVQADRPSSEQEVEGHVSFPAPSDVSPATGWLVAMSNETTNTFDFRAYVVCARP